MSDIEFWAVYVCGIKTTRTLMVIGSHEYDIQKFVDEYDGPKNDLDKHLNCLDGIKVKWLKTNRLEIE